MTNYTLDSEKYRLVDAKDGHLLLTVTLQVKPSNQLPFKDPYSEAKWVSLRMEKLRDKIEVKMRELKVVDAVVAKRDSKNEKILKKLDKLYKRQDIVKKDTRQIRRERIDLKQDLSRLGVELMGLDNRAKILRIEGDMYKQAF